MKTGLQLTGDFLQYYLSAKNRHDIHSPFLFELYTRAIKGNAESPKAYDIERLRKKLLADNRELNFTEYGAGKHGSRLRKVSEIASISAKNKKYASLLFRICDHLKPKTIIELGTSLGISTAYMASANPEKLYTLEGCVPVMEMAKENLSSLGFSNIEFITGNFDQSLPLLPGSISTFDLAFIDGNHRYTPTLRYFNLLLEKSNTSTCFIFDDINWSDEMKSAWKEIQGNKKVTLSIDLFFMGIVFIDPRLSKQHYTLRY